MSARVEELAHQLASESYAVWPALYSPAQIEAMRSELARVYREAGAPVPYGEGVRWLGNDVELSSTGFVVHKLLGRAASLQQGLLPPEAIAIVRRVLGDDMQLEMVAGVVSDHTRPFFEWHMHVGGIDDERYRREGLRPRFERPERISMLVYLDEMREDSGQLLVLPRRIDDPLEPPYPIASRRWEGQVAVRGPAGTAVLMEQSTWHAVLPRIEPSLRMFVGFWFAAAYATRAERTDETLRDLPAADEVLSSVLPRSPR